jgi:hypothetical protein
MKTKLLRKVRRKYAIYRVNRRSDTSNYDAWLWDDAEVRGLDFFYQVNDWYVIFKSVSEAKAAILITLRDKYKHLGKEGRMRKAVPVREKVWYNS